MRVITFSRTFPAKHPRKGEPTYFVEKIWAGLADKTDRMQGSVDMDFHEYYNGIPKWHTIRAGNRWKVGDFFSPRYWTGKPYASKQALITEPLEIKKIWAIRIMRNWVWIKDKKFSDFEFTNQIVSLARNDGLEIKDFWNWFDAHPKMKKEGFSGQILCWNEAIEYT